MHDSPMHDSSEPARAGSGCSSRHRLAPRRREVRGPNHPRSPFRRHPPLNDPVFIPGAAGAIEDEDFVVGVVIGGEAVAYPVKILNFHEIVTHIVGGQRIAVTYCPLTNSAVVFDATDITFGNTGALFNNNVVMYDTDTRSFWSQMAAGSIHGDRAGEHLSLLPVVHTRFRTWREFFPDTKLLSSSTGYSRNYRVDPYVRSGYTQNTDIFFPQGGPVDTRRHPKEMVFGLARNGSALAYPYTDLAAQGVVNDRVNGDDIVIFYDDPARLAIGFSRRLGGRLLHFRASESIDDRSPLFEDVETRSTWTILGGAVAGELDGSQLVGVATYSAYWFGWSSFWLGSDIWDGQSLTPPDTAVAESTWGQVKNRN